MAIYEKRTYTVRVGHMADVIELYTGEGFPAMAAGGFDDKLVGYFISDTGPLHQLIHIWRFDDDNDRRDFWPRLLSDEPFKAFGAKLRPSLEAQEVQLLRSAPWGPRP